MSREELINNKLEQQFNPIFLDVENETHNHNVPADAESHYKVIVVSKEFSGKPLIQRHRLINKCLANDLQNGIHALAMHTFTPEEWDKKEDKAMLSPKCHGGSK